MLEGSLSCRAIGGLKRKNGLLMKQNNTTDQNIFRLQYKFTSWSMKYFYSHATSLAPQVAALKINSHQLAQGVPCDQ